MKPITQPLVAASIVIATSLAGSVVAEPTPVFSSHANIMAVDPANGDVYITGKCDRFRQCGPYLNSQWNGVFTFNGMTGMKQVHSNVLRTFYLSKNGNVYTTGNRVDIQPRKIEFHNKVIDMASIQNNWYGKHHYFIVREGVYTVEGKTFEMGSLWLWDEDKSSVPVQVGDRKDYVMVSAGMRNVGVINKNGDLWTWGRNTLSYGDGYFNVQERSVPNLEPTVSGHSFRYISVGGNHMAAIDIQDRVWTWGSDADGKMCNGSTGESYVPALSLMENVSRVAASRSATAAVTNDGKLMTCGWHNLIYQGTSYNRDQSPKVVAFDDATPALTAQGGNSTSTFMDTAGGIWTWGGDSYGRLGNGGANVETHHVGSTLRRKDVEAIAIPDDVYWEPMIDESLVASSGKNKEKCNASANNGKGGNYEQTGMCDNQKGNGVGRMEQSKHSTFTMRADGRGFKRSKK